MEMYYEIEYTHRIRFDTLEEAEKELERLMLEYGNDKNYTICNRITYPNENCRPQNRDFWLCKNYELVDGKLKPKEPYYKDGRKPMILR